MKAFVVLTLAGVLVAGDIVQPVDLRIEPRAG
jgi:hypothetical protein